MTLKNEPLLYWLFVQMDNWVRHRGVLGRHQWLRNLLRKPYHRFINCHHRGIPIRIGNAIEAQLPPEFSSKLMEGYEEAAFHSLKTWLDGKENAVVIDVGCSVGYYSCACLFAGPSAKVYAIDSDLNSLKSLLRVCEYAPNHGRDVRLFPLWGLLSDPVPDSIDFSALSNHTRMLLESGRISGEPGTHRYMNLKKCANTEIPTYSLDALFGHGDIPNQDILIKIDVEGAELHVLKGARELLQNRRINLSLSIHPQFLGQYGHKAEDVHALLQNAGYKGEMLAKDHEEHWWFIPV